MASMTTEFAAKDTNFSSTTQRLQKSLAGFESSLDRFNASAANIGTSFTKLGAGLVAGVAAFVGIRSAAEGVKKAFDEAGQSQQFERRFETLLGSADAARQRMEQLEAFMDATPFALPGIVQASQTLETLTGSALSTGEGLRMVGDAASGTGQPIDEMAVTLGRLFNGLSEGGISVGNQTKRLVELGVITPQVAQQLNELAKEGVGSARAFELIQDATSKFSGEMRRQSTTWKATLEGLGDAINKALRNFATPLIEILTPQIQKVADFVRGTLAPAIEDAMSKFTSDWLPAFFDAAQTATDYLRGALSLAPSEMFELMIANMLDFQRIAADTLIGAFATAVSGLGNLMRELFANHVPQLIGETLGQAFIHDTTKLASALFKVLVEAVEYFGTLWESVTQMSAGELLKKLMEVVQSFATGWGRAMIDPIGFITQQIGKGLADTFVDAGHEFKFQFDKATGSWIKKTDKALENTSLAAGRKLGEAGSKLGAALLRSMEQAIRDTHAIEVNLFGSEEAARRMEARFAQMAEYGRQIREDAEEAANLMPEDNKGGKSPRVIDQTGQGAQGGSTMPSSGGGRGGPPPDPTTGYGAALRQRGSQSVNYNPASSRLSSTGLAIERNKERFSEDKMASSIRADLARMEKSFKPALDRAQGFEDAGQFGAAERLRGRINRRRSEREKQLAERYGISMEDQEKPEDQRKTEAEQNQPPGGGGDSNRSSVLDSIKETLQAFKESMEERLPQQVMGT
jgi:ABC-type transporter Mla subunit MlaD